MSADTPAHRIENLKRAAYLNNAVERNTYMAANPGRRYTLEEYLELDRISEERLEFWDGEVFGEKFSHYNSIPTLREYLLVAQHHPHVTHLFKDEAGRWIHTQVNDLESSVRLHSLDCELPMSEIYRDVTFGPRQPLEARAHLHS